MILSYIYDICVSNENPPEGGLSQTFAVLGRTPDTHAPMLANRDLNVNPTRDFNCGLLTTINSFFVFYFLHSIFYILVFTAKALFASQKRSPKHPPRAECFRASSPP